MAGVGRQIDPQLMVPAEQGSDLNSQRRRMGRDAVGQHGIVDSSGEHPLPTLDHQVDAADLFESARAVERSLVADRGGIVGRSARTIFVDRGGLRQTYLRLPRCVVASPTGTESNAMRHERYITLSDWLSTMSTADW